MANVLTMCRIVLSLALLVPPALSPVFLAVYTAAGVTDMADGLIARRTSTESELGARLDSVADFVLVVACLVKILPAIAVPMWLWVWVALIVVIKAANVIGGLVLKGHLVLPHTTANKVAGMVAFLVPFALTFLDVAVVAIPACAVATFAAVQESHLITRHTKKIGPSS